MEKKLNSISEIAFKTLNILSLIVLLLIAITNIFVYVQPVNFPEKVTFEYSTIIPITISIILVAGMWYIVNKQKISSKMLLAMSIALNATLSILFIYFSGIPAILDQFELKNIATKLVKGVYASDVYEYLAIYTHQAGLVLYNEILIRLFGNNSILIGQYLNVIYNSIIILMLYKITKISFNSESANRAIAVLTAIFPHLIYLSTFVYGDQPGLAFSLVAMYYAIKFVKQRKEETEITKINEKNSNLKTRIKYIVEKYKYVIYVAIALSVAMLFRENMLIFAIAIYIYILLSILINNKKEETNYQKPKIKIEIQYIKEKIKKLLIFLSLVLITVGVMIIPGEIIKFRYAKNYGIEFNRPMPSLAFMLMGAMDSENRSPGWWNGITTDMYYVDYKDNYSKMKEELPQRYIKHMEEKLKHPLTALKFYLTKTVSMWAENTHLTLYQNRMVFYHDSKVKDEQKAKIKENIEGNRILRSFYFGKMIEINQIYAKALSIVIYIGAIYAVIRNRKAKNKEMILLTLTLMGGFALHTIWEGKSRYVLPYVIILLPIVASVFESKKTKLQAKKQ